MLDLNGIIDVLNNKDKQYNPMLTRWRDVYYGLSLHIDGACPSFKELGSNYWIYPCNYFGREYDYIFNLFLLNRYPRESDETRNYRLSQYRAFTQDPFLKIISVVTGAIFQDSGYSITIDDREDSEYIWGENFGGKNLPAFIAEKFKNICEDPNGVFLTIPKEPYYATTTKSIEPEIYFVPSKDIMYVTKDEIIFRRDELFWAVNGIGYFRFQQDGNKYIHIDEKYGGYFAHLMGRKPIIKAGGIWNTQGFYESWLQAAKPLADEYIGAVSSGQLVNKNASYPFIIEPSSECPVCNGSKTVQWCTTCNCISANCQCDNVNDYSNYGLHSCNSCGGTGQVAQDPLQRIIAPKEDLAHNLVQIISPDTSINKFHSEHNAELYTAMLRALNLHYIEEAQSGVAKDKDMETKYQFLLSISNDLFDRVIEGIIQDILSLRNVRSVNGSLKPDTGSYNIVKPAQFQIQTSMDLLLEYKEATQSYIPDYQKQAILVDYTDKRFGGNKAFLRMSNIINELDPISATTTADISILLLNNAISNRDVQFHVQLPKMLHTLIRERGDDWFLDAKFEVIATEIKTMFDALIPPPITLQPNNITERVET